MSALHAWLAHARDTPDKKGVHACGCLERDGHIILCDEGKRLRAEYIAEDIAAHSLTSPAEIRSARVVADPK